MLLYERIEECLAYIRARVGVLAPRVGMVLGSGLGAFAEGLSSKVEIPYAELPYFPRASVPGHAGRLVLGVLARQSVVAMQGRVHHYEGYTAAEVAFPIRVLCKMGIKTLLVTNSAGGINPEFRPGDLMVITDHLNLFGLNPLIGPNEDRLGPRFPDMTEAYDSALTLRLVGLAQEQGVALKRGVYAFLSGPSYETPAEIRALRTLGADAVGMSTVPEVVAARQMGARVVGVSCIANLAAGMAGRPLTHDEVSATAARASATLAALVTGLVPLAAELT